MVRWAAVFLVGFLLMLGVSVARAQDTRPPAQFWMEVEPAKGDRHVQQMIVVHLHSLYVRPVALLKSAPFKLPDFQISKLGRGRWYTHTGDGFETLAFEQVLGLFPKKSGQLVIPPFVQQLTYVDYEGKRVAVELKTEPAEILIKPAAVSKNVWWLPASKLTAEENWSADPSNLEQGEPVRRTITVKAIGQLANQMPPPPDLTTSGLVVSAATPVKETVMGLPSEQLATQFKPGEKSGLAAYVKSDRAAPISTVTYSWLIRPTSGEAVDMPPLELNWFNTDTGKSEQIVFPGKTITFKDPGPSLDDMERSLGIVAEAPSFAKRWALVDKLAQGLVFLTAMTATLMLLSSRFRKAIAQIADRARSYMETRRMRRAAKRGDTVSVWRIYRSIVGADPGHDGLRAEDGTSPVAQLQAAVFGTRSLTIAQLRGIASELARRAHRQTV